MEDRRCGARRRRAFLRKWRLKCRAVADSLEEAGDRLFTFTRLDPSQWMAARTSNAIERLNEEFRRPQSHYDLKPVIFHKTEANPNHL